MVGKTKERQTEQPGPVSSVTQQAAGICLLSQDDEGQIHQGTPEAGREPVVTPFFHG